LAGRVAVVTGGTRGIGRAVADRFAAAGADVVTLARSSVADAPGATPRHHIAADLSDESQIRRAFAEIEAVHGRVDVLVNNAGGARPGALLDYRARHAQHAFALNVLGPLLASQCAHPLFPEAGGAIVNIGSVAGLRASPGTGVYGAAKAALLSLTRSLALEWAPRIRVNIVLAGPVLTEAATAYYGGGEAAAAVGARLPAGRLAAPADIAEACLFLASDAAAYVSGAELLVHGGGETPGFSREARGPGPGRP
jgi:NAD(P)-dependent dehydrogenase (short-subunit alcohol dehydrogenase family)